MNPIADIKRFTLRVLIRAEAPVPEAYLDDSINRVVVPKPLQSDINEARRELVADGFIYRRCDELDPTSVTWTLTTKGEHAAGKLG